MKLSEILISKQIPFIQAEPKIRNKTKGING